MGASNQAVEKACVRTYSNTRPETHIRTYLLDPTFSRGSTTVLVPALVALAAPAAQAAPAVIRVMHLMRKKKANAIYLTDR